MHPGSGVLEDAVEVGQGVGYELVVGLDLLDDLEEGLDGGLGPLLVLQGNNCV